MRLFAIALVVVLGCSSGDKPEATPAHVTWVSDEAAAFERARTERKGVLLHFFFSYSVPSVELQQLFRDPAIGDVIAHDLIPVELDLTEDNERNDQLRTRYSAPTLPLAIVVDANGEVLARIHTLMTPPQLLAVLRPAIEKLRSAPRRGAAPP